MSAVEPVEHANPPMVPVSGRIKRRLRETKDTFTLEIEPDQPGNFDFTPGQFNMLYVFGVGEIPISISGDPANRSTLTHTIREVGVVTRVLHGLSVGDHVGLRGPFGTPWPVRNVIGKDLLIVAGGIGLAPLRPVIYEVLAHRELYGRITILVGARTPENLIFRKQLSTWSARLDLEVFATVDRATRTWYGNVGVITSLIPRTGIDPANTIAMICGPEIMMHFAVLELNRRRLQSEQIYVSMERNMQCAVGLCGHCQYGPVFVCKDGPVFRFDQVEALFRIREF